METTAPVKRFRDFGIKQPEAKALIGPRSDINKLFGKEITVHSCEVKDSKLKGKNGEQLKCLHMQIEVNGSKQVLFSGSTYMLDHVRNMPPDGYPFQTVIMKFDNDSHQFT